MSITRFAAAILLISAILGCRNTAGPDWFHPGNERVQQTRALRYDPYPEAQSGPAMVGVRPRCYENPPPEASRARWTIGNWGQ